jgi:site-specific DNA-methyltransferase (adenine-specific)
MAEMAKYGEKWAHRNGRSPYPVMTTEDLCKMPVKELAAKNSLLLLWATSPKLDDAMEVMKSWGFNFINVLFVWIKLNPSGIGWHFGMGFHSRQNAEFVLLGARGNGLKRVNNSISSLVIWPRGRHSAKPPITRDRIDHLYGDVYRIELFSRDVVSNWDRWGNEVTCSEGAKILDPYLIPPIECIVDEDEYQGLPVVDTRQEFFSYGEQMPLMMEAA